MEVFDRAFREDMEERFAGRPDWERPDLAFVALSPERATVRSWIDTEVTALAEPGRSKLVARLRDDSAFATAYNELAVAAVLRDAGVCVLYEPLLDGLTPDLFAPAGRHGPSLLVDVWTREVPQAARGARRAWEQLVHRVAGIPVPVGLLVQPVGGGTPNAPTSGQSKEIAGSLRSWLLRSQRRRGDSHEAAGYRFTVLMDVPGLRARVAPPTGGGWVDSDVVVRAIRTKVRRYRDLAERLDASLVVVTASDPSAPLDLDLLRSALSGRQSFSFSFSPGASGPIGSWSGPMLAEHRPVAFDSALSGVGFVNPRLADPLLTLIPMVEPTRSIPRLASRRVEHADLT